MEQFSENNPNPMLSVSKDGTVLWSNEVGEPLLREWDMKVGEKLPSGIGDFAQKVISQNSPQRMEVKVGKKSILIVFHPLPNEERVYISGFDISDQKEIERKLRESENKYRNIVETSVEGIWIFNAVSETTYVNEKMAEMLGYNREEMIGSFIWDFAYEEDKDIFQLKLANRKLGIDEVYELKLVRKDGSPLWVSVSAKGFFDDTGKFEGSVGMFTDITERKRVEKALKESEEKYRIVTDNTHDWEFWLGPDGHFLYISPSCERVTGYAVWEFMNNPDLLQEIIHPDDRLAFLQHKHAMPSSSHGDIEFRILTKDGETRWIHHMCQPIYDDKGRYAGNRGSNRDITERKLAEEILAFERSQLLSIFDGMDDVVYVTDPYTYEVLYANKAMKEKFDGDLVGGICYREFQRRESPCNFCTNPIILKERSKPYHWEYYNPMVDRYFIIMDRIIKWPDGRDVRLEIAKDITERRNAEEALKKAHENLEEKVKERTSELEEAYKSLKESEKGLAEAQRMAHIGNWKWDIATDKAYWSEEMYRIFKRDPQKLAPSLKEYLSYIHPDDLNYYCKINDYTRKVPTSGLDFRIVLANGEERTIHIKSDFIFNNENNPIQVKGIVQDITERKKTEEEIRYLANIVESSKDAIVTVSLDGIVTSWNKGAKQIFGYTDEEILGKKVSMLEPDNRRGEIKYFIEEIRQGKKIKLYESSRLKKDGTIIIISGTLSPVLDTSGKLVAISIIARDITDKKSAEEKLRDSEEKYRNIVETANEGILITDKENIITYVNQKLVDMLGYKLENFIGSPIWGFISEEYRPIVKQNLEKRMQGISGSYELKLIQKNGSPLWTFLNAKPLLNKDGKYVGAMSMLTDITERKKAEVAMAEIEIARKKEIHHRIKNNLQVISSLLDLQADQFKNKECIQDYEVLEAFRESQARVISMALIHEELYKGDGFETLNFSPYIQELAENLLQTYRVGNIDISLKLNLAENPFFDMDIAVPLGMIVNELVTNSLKHAFLGINKGEIQIKLSREENGKSINEKDKSTNFILTVSDNGIGIPENINIEDLDTLGMQLVISLIDQLDGELELKRDNGTEFIIRFIVEEKDNQASMAAPDLIE